MVWGPAKFERDACEESVCRDQLLDQQLEWQKSGAQRKYLSLRQKIGNLSVYKWHLKPWEGERDVRKEEKPALRVPTLREKSCPQKETAGREQAARTADIQESPRRECLTRMRPQVVDRPWIPGHTQWGGGGGGGSRGEEGRKRSQEEHQHSRGGEKETWGWRGTPWERGKVWCSPPLGQNLHPLDSALRAGRAEAQSPRCRGHKLEGPLDTVCCGQIGKPGLKQPYQAHSRFTQDDDSWCFSAPSLSPLTEFYCFTLEDYKWGGVLRTYLSLRAWIFPSSVETCPFIIRRGKLLYPRLINYVLRLHVQCEYFIFVVRVYSLMHETLLCITYAE